MTEYQVTSPVAFLIFNRPDTTERVFAEIARAKPRKLLVVADGPRPDRPGEAEKCAAARAVIERVDWDCELLKNYSEVNLGCKVRVSSGLDWVFDTVEEAIILEDDCLPNLTFFRFCDEMLDRYRDDTRIMQICGTNYFKGWRRSANSYYFSKYGPIWGWASWRRAWKYYDVDMKLWPEVKLQNVHYDFSDSDTEVEFRVSLYDQLYAGEVNTWDYQWTFAKLINSGLSVTPNINLISNIGFGEDCTHLSNRIDQDNMRAHDMQFPLIHPDYICRDTVSDKRYFDTVTVPKTPLYYMVRVLKSIMPATFYGGLRKAARVIMGKI